MTAEKSFEQRCPNCDQQLFADEDLCWQCGYHILDKPPVAEHVVQAKTRQTQQRTLATIVYGGQTALLILTAVLLTYLLGRQPRVQPADVALPEGWDIVADRQPHFTAYLPREWEGLDAGDEEERDQITQRLAANTAYRSATKPLGDLVRDEEIVFLALESRPVADGNPSPFLVVARSARLNQLTPEEAIAFARESDVVVHDAQQVDNNDKSHVALSIEIPDIGQEGLVCQQQFTTGDRYAILFALCSAEGPLAGRLARTILGSFQRLAP